MVSAAPTLRLELSAYENATLIDSSSIDIQVLDDPPELQNPLPNPQLMSKIASFSGGKVLSDAASLAATLRELPNKEGSPRVEKAPVWSTGGFWLRAGIVDRRVVLAASFGTGLKQLYSTVAANVVSADPGNPSGRMQSMQPRTFPFREELLLSAQQAKGTWVSEKQRRDGKELEPITLRFLADPATGFRHNLHVFVPELHQKLLASAMVAFSLSEPDHLECSRGPSGGQPPGRYIDRIRASV